MQYTAKEIRDNSDRNAARETDKFINLVEDSIREKSDQGFYEVVHALPGQALIPALEVWMKSTMKPKGFDVSLGKDVLTISWGLDDKPKRRRASAIAKEEAAKKEALEKEKAAKS